MRKLLAVILAAAMTSPWQGAAVMRQVQEMQAGRRKPAAQAQAVK